MCSGIRGISGPGDRSEGVSAVEGIWENPEGVSGESLVPVSMMLEVSSSLPLSRPRPLSSTLLSSDDMTSTSITGGEWLKMYSEEGSKGVASGSSVIGK